MFIIAMNNLGFIFILLHDLSFIHIVSFKDIIRFFLIPVALLEAASSLLYVVKREREGESTRELEKEE